MDVVEVTDDFNRANAGIGAPWTTTTGSAAVVSNRGQVTGSAWYSFHGTPVTADEHWAEVTFVSGGGTSSQSLHIATVGTSDTACNLIRYDGAGKLQVAQLSGGFRVLAEAAVTWAPPHVVRGEYRGGTLYAYLDGVLVVSSADSRIGDVDGRRVGLRFNEASVVFDNFRAGTFSTATTGTGSVLGPPATVAGTGLAGALGSGDLTAPVASGAGAGLAGVLGAGELTAAAPTVVGTGAVIDVVDVTATGQLTAPRPTTFGRGRIGQPGVGAWPTFSTPVYGRGSTAERRDRWGHRVPRSLVLADGHTMTLSYSDPDTPDDAPAMSIECSCGQFYWNTTDDAEHLDAVLAAHPR